MKNLVSSDSIQGYKAYLQHLGKTLKYALYVISHPLDGFWDLTHEKRGSLAAANVIVLLTLLTQIWRLQFTSFVFMRVNWEYVNIFMQIASTLVPLLIWCLANWGLTTLFDGKGTLSQVYMGTAYALTPYPLIQIPLIFLSNCITAEEGSFYMVLSSISLIWTVMLIFLGMMMIHSYSLGKNILFTIASLFGMAVIIFILLLLFSLISDALAYFISLYKEIVFRL